MNNITQNIVEKIKAGEVQMQPRWHFVLRSILLLLGVFLVALIAVYLLSFVFFALHKNGLYLAPLMGRPGIVLFIVESPWLLISLLGLFILVLHILVSQYSFSYRKPLVYSIVAIVFLVVGVSSLIQYSGMHQRLDAFAQRGGMPGLAALYLGAENNRPAGVVPGVVVSLTDTGFVMRTLQAESVAVVVNARTKIPQDAQLRPGDRVVVFGKNTDTGIEAFGIRPVQSDSRLEKMRDMPRDERPAGLLIERR